MIKKKTKVITRNVYDLLELLKETYNDHWETIFSLCGILDWLHFEGFVTTIEKEILEKYMKDNKPDELHGHYLWFSPTDRIGRIYWLNENIKLNS
jgi:hypothetical protein